MISKFLHSTRSHRSFPTPHSCAKTGDESPQATSVCCNSGL